MSLNILVVPENPTYNGSILKPVCERLFTECGKAKANIEIMANPRTNGYEHAKSLFPDSILDLYSHKHLVLFVPDSDGQDRTTEFSRLEIAFEQRALNLAKPIRLMCCAAVPELEAWVLAGHQDKWESGWQWSAMRMDASIKENYFRSFLEKHGLPSYPDGGRRQLMVDGLRNYAGIKQRCPELQELENRIKGHLRQRTELQSE